MAVTLSAKGRAVEVARRLRAAYPHAKCSLNFRSPLQLLVATILSAQCTDERVNLVTRELFKKYPGAADFARARLPELERDIQSTGFFRNKAKNIQAACRAIVQQHQGHVPQELDQLVALPGVGRKTANVVLGTAFGIASGVVVDTHMLRVARRLGLTKHESPEKVEQDLNGKLPPQEWVAFSHRIIQHGRKICTARRAFCEQCTLADICPKIGVKKLGAKNKLKVKPA
jgi:endonuclease III